MTNFLLQAASPLGLLGGTAQASIGAVIPYVPYAIVGAVAIGLYMAWRARKNQGMGVPGVQPMNRNGLLGGVTGAIAPGAGMGNQMAGMAAGINLMLVYSSVQRRIVAIRPFQVVRDKDPSGNILEKRAEYMDTMNQQKNNGMAGRLQNAWSLVGRIFGRGSQKQEEEQMKEGVAFTERFAVGMPNGSWLSSITLEENSQLPLFPDRMTETTLYEQMKKLNEQYDKRISRLKEAALTINQYAANANTPLNKVLGKEMMIMAIIILIFALIIFYSTGQLASAINQVGSNSNLAAAVHAALANRTG